MKVVFISNFLNHHQLPFCKAMIENGVDFHFVATERIPEERTSLGYTDMNKQYPFVIRSYEDRKLAIQVIREADAVLEGTISSALSKDYAFNGGLTFHFSERLYRKVDFLRFRPKAYKFVNDLYLQFGNLPNFYVLCVGAYVSRDLDLWDFPSDKCIKWGYFPEIPSYERKEKGEDEPVSILWCGRLMPLKHPEYAIHLAEHIKKNNLNAKITIAGNGQMEKKLLHLISVKQLGPYVEMKGSLPYQEVYQLMHNTDIFLFTSNKQEGWGAVVNESMASGCAIVANMQPGSVPYLIQNRKNGLIYQKNDVDSFIRCVDELIANPVLRKKLGEAARKTIEDTWNARNAAKQLISFIEHHKEPDYDYPAYGPCSKAEIIEE